MNKINLYAVLCAAIMLGSTIEIKPMTGRIGAYALNGLAASISGIAAGFSTYLLAHTIQWSRVNTLGWSCVNSTKKLSSNFVYGSEECDDSFQATKTLVNSNHFTMGLFQKQAIIECMKNKNPNARNFNYCVKLTDKINSKRN